jgi:uncharacterized membrane protein YccC
VDDLSERTARMTPPTRWQAQLREVVRTAPVRPNLAAGLRTALATVVPVLAAPLLGGEAATWLGLAGFMVSLADKGGAYRTRAAAMGALAVVGAVSATVGALAAPYPVLAVALVLVWGVAGALVQVYGTGAQSVGTSSGIVFLISLAAPAASVEEAVHRGLFVIVGGAWAMLLSLVLWPLAPYGPARRSVAGVWRALAVYAERWESYAARGAGERPDFAPVRAALEGARGTLGASRRGRMRESPRGERLLVLLESADRSLPLLVSLGDVLEGAPPGTRPAAMRSLAAFAETARAVADAVESDRKRTVALPDAPGPPADPRVARLLGSLVVYARAAADTASGVVDESSPARLSEPLAPAPRRPLLEPLRETLSPDSVFLRHALRVGITTALAMAATQAMGVHRGYWVTVTAFIVLQPYIGATTVKGMQRIVGTVLGALLAVAIALVVRDPHGILAAIFVLAVVAVSLLPVNYAVYSVFLTPTFVLLAELNAHDWHLAGLRVANTLLGGALALVGARLLWSSPESSRFPGQAAAAIRSCAAFLRGATAGFPAAELAALRRQSGLALMNAEASFQRVLAEAPNGDPRVEPGMAMLAFTRRLSASIVALAYVHLHAASPGEEALAAFGAAASDALEGVADAVAEERPPSPLPALPAESLRPGDTALGGQLARIAAQVEVLHEAAGRMGGSAES